MDCFCVSILKDLLDRLFYVEVDEVIINRYEKVEFSNSELSLRFDSSEKGDKYVYVLALQDGKYYVGYTANIKERLLAHFTGRGAKYTKSHPPIHVFDILIDGSKELEKSETLRMMSIYGRDNVRGYAWCSEHPNKYFPNIK